MTYRIIEDKRTGIRIRVKDLGDGTYGLGVTPEPAQTLEDGDKDVATAGVREQLAGDTPCREVIITGKAANGGYIYVGGSSVSSTRYMKRLSANGSIVIGIDNLNKVYLDSSVNGEGVSYGYLN